MMQRNDYAGECDMCGSIDNGGCAVLSDVGELLRCPFCGSIPNMGSLGGDNEHWMIWCDNCKIALSEMGVSGETKEDIIRAWNTRANVRIIRHYYRGLL